MSAGKNEKRERRCCIIAGNEKNQKRYLEDQFADAPFVHPFRAPSYHAQHLRSIAFAKTRQQKILWITAFDKFINSGKAWTSENSQKRKERWLEYHERFTNGIPGLFPCVVDLPVRFTDSPSAAAREQGISKHARGFLRGWELPDEELQRVDAFGDAPEVVLKKRPVKLFIEVPKANAKLPLTNGRKMFVLRVCMKVLHLDKDNKVPVQRF